jgi:molybdopterin-guanine dinucleotide biosynthesis protein A
MLAPIADCTGVLLAGGRAERLGGIPKGLLRVDGVPIVARSLALFETLFGEALLVTSTPAPYAALGAVTVPDLLSGRGAPGGLHAALTAARTEWVFAAACDMPFLAEAPIRLLAAQRAGADAVLVRVDGRPEPLHAFWSRACLPALSRLLAEGRPSLRALAGAVSTRYVEEAAFRAADPDGRALANVNTPEDAARLGIGL